MIDFTRREILLLEDMIEALRDGFEYFTEDNADTFSSLSEKISSELDRRHR